jgi:hypothetical protein
MPRGAWLIRPGKIQVVYGAPFTSEEMAGLQVGDDAAFCELARQRVSACVARAQTQLKGKLPQISQGN